MPLKEDLQSEVKQIFKENWTERNSTVVPEDNSLTLGNTGANLQATVLYADISESTQLVDTQSPKFAAEIYKAFLRCAARIIGAEGGTITAYDGDRIMAVFIGNSKNTNAVRAGLKINWAAKNIVQPAFKESWPSVTFTLRHTVGIDTSPLLAAKIGVRGANDLVWIGRAANYAAKLCTLDHQYATWITSTVYENMNAEVKNSSDGRNMWEERSWTAMNKTTIYRSSFWWRV